jgi:subtilisin family serine protease
MKAFLILLFLLTSMTNIAQETDYASLHVLDPYNPEFEPGEVIIKFNDDLEIMSLKSANGMVQTGISRLDKILRGSNAKELIKLFPHQQRLKSARMITINGETRPAPQLHNFYKLKVTASSDIKQLISELEAEPEIEFAEPNYYIYSQEVLSKTKQGTLSVNENNKSSDLNSISKNTTSINDPLYDQQWYLQAINAEGAWAKEPTGGKGQVIAILDTGVDYLHPDLDDNIWNNEAELNGVEGVDDDGNGFVDDILGWDWVNNDNDPKDDNSHGTHVAGIAAAEQNNGTGITGVAFGAKIMPLKVLQSSGRGNSGDLAAAITYASENGATVINMSLGSYGESLTVKAALENAYSTSIPVAAAGNDGKGIYGFPMFPACYSFVIGVEATTSEGKLAQFSNFDEHPIITNTYNHNYELKAPGVNIISTIPGGNYRIFNGTSMAAPVVAGTVALIDNYETQTKEQIFTRLIQSSEQNINIDLAMGFILVPDLFYSTQTLIDTIGIADEDGAPDAGEIIEIWLSVKNGGGWADSVYVNLSLGEFEDPSVATIQKPTQYIGDISEYATLTGEVDPWKIQINQNVVNDRDVVFEYEIGCKNSQTIKLGTFILKVQNGRELSGVMDSTMMLSAKYLWLVNKSFRIGPNGVLNIEPGTTINMYVNWFNQGIINSLGTHDSIIQFNLLVSSGGTCFQGGINNFSFTNFIGDGNSFNQVFNIINELKADYCTFQNFDCVRFDFSSSAHTEYTNCYFKDLTVRSYIDYNVFDYNNIDNLYLGERFLNDEFLIKYNNFSRVTILSPGKFNWLLHGNEILGNNFLTKIDNGVFGTIGYATYDSITNNYWGTTDPAKIENKIYDFWEEALFAQAVYYPILTQPSDSAHGCVWKVEVNEIDPQDEYLDPVGAEELKFDVYFNKCMDTTYTPQLSFGVSEPYTQNIVTKNGKWSADSTIWTAYYDVGLKTGDGINQIRVTNAVDTAGFEIPIEVERFQFIIQAAGAASLAFQATPGIGKVDLEWPAGKTDDALGYNLYRYQNLTDSTFTEPVLINTALILDTLYRDMEVIPNTTYHYRYKTVGTDMQETDFSKAVSATPFNAANGDANGDLEVNVLDVTTIVAYLLDNDPRPFLFDAADLNGDGVINVLDIVGVINLILNPGSTSLKSVVARQADITIENDIVYINTPIQLAGLQFTLNNIASAGDLQLLEDLEGFEIIRQTENGKLTIIAYSLLQKTIGPGKVPLFRLTNSGSKIFEAILSDKGGIKVDANLSNTATLSPEIKLNEGFVLGQNYPNPFTGRTTIPFTLETEADEVLISVTDITGRLVKTWQMNHLTRGQHKVEWNESNIPGIYIYRMYIESGGHRSYAQTKRMIIK